MTKKAPDHLHEFYKSTATPCPYLPNKTEQKLFTHLSGPNPYLLNSILTQSGFRRSHDILYRPDCPSCQACKAARINVHQFKLTKTQKRLLNKNKGFSWSKAPAKASPQAFQLFSLYQNQRHSDSDMRFMTDYDFTEMIEVSSENSCLFKSYSGQDLKSVMFCDALIDGYSAIYSFYDPALLQHSLGIWMILKLVQQTLAEGKDYVYLGYWIKESPKMSYKKNFHGVEILTDSGWTLLNP